MKQWIVFACVILIAIGFRFFALTTTPPGLFFDEAMDGNQALQGISTGHFQVFYPENFGREGLFIWLASVPLALWGNHVWALRSVSALAGVLTVAALFLLVRRFGGERLALIASFLLATSFWHVLFSRLGFRVILAPLFLVLTLYFLIRGFDKLELAEFAAAGICYGLGFHTYLAFRVTPLVIAVVILAYWKREALKGVVVMVGVTVAIVAPLAGYFYQHPMDLSGRINQVSVGWTGLWSNVVATLGMFNVRGDHNWRHNYSDAPMLPFVLGIFFLVGIGLMIWRHGKTDAIVLTWLVAALVPAALSDNAPHALRSLLVVPAVYIIVAEGIQFLMQFRYASVLAVILLFGTATLEGQKYFYKWAHHPMTALALSSDDVHVGEVLNTMPQSRQVIVVVPPNANYPNINGLPLVSQTVMFMTDTFTKEKQELRHFHYTTVMPENIPQGAVVVTLR
jgi:4-amino-4-deoxy-L-arabinose transferase-like glycosyltransferase